MLKKLIKEKLDIFKNSSISMDKKNFYLVMVANVLICLALFIVFSLKQYRTSITMLSILLGLLIISMMYISNITGEEKLYSSIYCIVINVLINPLLFFLTGDIYNGAAIFFALGIIVTVFFNSDSKFLWLYITIENVYYFLIFLFVYRNKELFVTERENIQTANAISICFIIGALCVTFICLYYSYIYKTAKDSMDEANREISVAQSSKTRFLANMTHEIRTPMNAIIGMSNLILKEDLNQNTRDHANTIKNASSHLLRVINGILEYSKLDSGKVQIYNSEYSFKALISELVNSVAKEYRDKNVILHVFASKSIPDSLFGDDIRIKQVFKYLLFSSLSLTENSTVRVEINEDIDESKMVTFNCRISSTGTGYSAEDLDSLFTAYSVYDSRKRIGDKGIGLELNICKAILNLMDGDLKIDSIEGIGTSVSFSFKNYIVDPKPICNRNKDIFCKPLIYISDEKYENPWKRLLEDFNISAVYVRNLSSFQKTLEETRFSHIFVHETSYESIKDILSMYDCRGITYLVCDYDVCYGDYDDIKILRHPIYSVNFSDAINGTWSEEEYVKKEKESKLIYPEARVLIVDDSMINIKVEESLLSNYAITPTVAMGGREALDLLKHEVFDLVLLDQKMPEFDGIDTIHALRTSDYAMKDVPVVCVTAEFGADTKDKLVAEGFDDYLAKPINLVYFERVLNRYIPEELGVVKKANESDISSVVQNEQSSEIIDTGSDNVDNEEELIVRFQPEEGLKNLGGSMDAFLSVLLSYYNECSEKLSTVPAMFESGDISLYTTNVHALKSSSATVGALGISPLFKALEFAGKDNNVEYIAENSGKAFEYLEKVLLIVKEYLIEQDAFEEAVEEVEGDIQTLNTDMLNDLVTAISTMNLRQGEQIINELISVNYGTDINKKLREVRDNIDNFEYVEAKTIVESLL